MKNITLIVFLFLSLNVSVKAAEVFGIPLLDMPDRAYALIIAPIKDTRLTAEERAVFTEIQSIALSLPSMLMAPASDIITNEASRKEAILSLGQSLQRSFAKRLSALGTKLPENMTYFGLYLIPFLKDSPEYRNAIRNNNPLSLPIPLIVVEHNNVSDRAAFYWRVDKNVVEGQAWALENKVTPLYFIGSTIILGVSKDSCSLKFQVYTGLAAREEPFEKINEQVRINKVEIPTFSRKGDAPTALLSISIPPTSFTALNDLASGSTKFDPSIYDTDNGDYIELARPETNAPVVAEEKFALTMTLDFGRYGGITTASNGNQNMGHFQIMQDVLDNETEFKGREGVPTLHGFVNDKATGNVILDKLAKGWQIRFRIMKIDIDARTLQAKNMEVAIDVLGFTGIRSSDVNDKFKKQANEAIAEMKNKFLGSDVKDDLTNKIMDFIYARP